MDGGSCWWWLLLITVQRILKQWGKGMFVEGCTTRDRLFYRLGLGNQSKRSSNRGRWGLASLQNTGLDVCARVSSCLHRIHSLFFSAHVLLLTAAFGVILYLSQCLQRTPWVFHTEFSLMIFTWFLKNSSSILIFKVCFVRDRILSFYFSLQTQNQCSSLNNCQSLKI